jgi:hypothetical protein
MQGVKMKKFLVQIHAYNYSAKFEILAHDTRESIEQSILDKLGQKTVKWEKDGFRDSSRSKWITYEEVNNDSRPIQYETVLGTRVATGTPEGGQI